MRGRDLGRVILIAVVVAAPAAATEQFTADTIIFGSEASVGEVHFPHRFHFDELEIECSECHHETDARVLDIPHQEYFQDFWIDCTTCHHDSEQPRLPTFCSTCHRRRAECADETLSAKVVIHASCWRCHEIGTGREASAACSHCHLSQNRDR